MHRNKQRRKRLWLNVALGVIILYLVALMNLIINFAATVGTY